MFLQPSPTEEQHVNTSASAGRGRRPRWHTAAGLPLARRHLRAGGAREPAGARPGRRRRASRRHEVLVAPAIGRLQLHRRGTAVPHRRSTALAHPRPRSRRYREEKCDGLGSWRARGEGEWASGSSSSARPAAARRRTATASRRCQPRARLPARARCGAAPAPGVVVVVHGAEARDPFRALRSATSFASMSQDAGESSSRKLQIEASERQVEVYGPILLAIIVVAATMVLRRSQPPGTSVRTVPQPGTAARSVRQRSWKTPASARHRRAPQCRSPNCTGPLQRRRHRGGRFGWTHPFHLP